MTPPPQTARLALRQMDLRDLDDMAELLGDPRVMRHYPRPKDRAEARGWIEWNQRLYHEHGHGLWLLTLRADGAFVGDCGLTPQTVEGQVDVELGYHVRAELWGNGYATEAAAACRDWARDVLGLARLIAIIDAQPCLPTGGAQGRAGRTATGHSGRDPAADLCHEPP